MLIFLTYCGHNYSLFTGLQEVSYMKTAPKMITVFEYIYRNSIENFYLKKLYMNTALEIQQTFYEIYFGLLLNLRNDPFRVGHHFPI